MSTQQWLRQQEQQPWWQRSRYAYPLAACSVALAAALVAVIERWWEFPPLMLLAAAVAASTLGLGVGPGVCALVLATLASDFLFVEPTLTWSLDGRVAELGFRYLYATALAWVLARMAHRNRRKGRPGS